MDLFISWSGDRSKAIAYALHSWLPMVINAVKPWMSEASIEAGTRWGKVLAEKLATTKIGIICLTPENLDASWILFEAGALSKTLDDDTRVVPYIYDLKKTDVTGPLRQFQAKCADQEDTKSLIHTINEALGPDSKLPDELLNRSFERLWPHLQQMLDQIPPPKGTAKPPRTERDLLEESVSLLRLLERKVVGPGFKRRREITRLEEFTQGAEGILIIARTASRVAGQTDLFKEHLERGCRVRFVITSPEAYHKNVVEAVMPMPLTSDKAMAAFSGEIAATQANIQHLQKVTANMRGSISARSVNYMSNLSFIMVDQGNGRGRIIAELMPYKCPLDERPYIELSSDDPSWYDLFRDTCEEIWAHATPLSDNPQ